MARAFLLVLVGCWVFGFGVLEAPGKEKRAVEGDESGDGAEEFRVYLVSDWRSRKGTPEWKVGGALQRWQGQLSEAVGRPVELALVGSPNDIQRELEEGKVTVVVAPVVAVPECKGMIPEFLVEHAGGLTSPYLLVAPATVNLRAGRMPAGVLLVESEAGNPLVGERWALNQLGEEERLEVLHVTQSAEVVLPVFFGQAEYGVVGEEGFAREVARNPQVEERVTVVGRSEPILGDVVLIREDVTEGTAAIFRQAFSDGMKDGPAKLIFQHLGWHAFRPVRDEEEQWIAGAFAAVERQEGEADGGLVEGVPAEEGGGN